jgi:hypothetical protein
MLLLVLSLVVTAYGQETGRPTDKGNTMMGGTLNFMSFFGNFYANNTSFVLTPFAQHFIKNNLMVGLMFQLAINSQEGFSQSAFNVGPTVGYTFKKFKEGEKIKGAFIPYAKVGILFSSFTNKFEDWKLSHSGFAFPIGGGAIYMLSRVLGLIGDVYFAFERQKWNEADEGEGGARFVVSFGLTYCRYKK